MFGRLLVVSVLVVACGKGDTPPEPSSGITNKQETGPKPRETEADRAAMQLFMTQCANCHGTEGKGNGPASAALNPKPRNYTDPAWQASVTDDEIRKIILEGGAAVGKSSSMMSFSMLKEQPDVLESLVKIVRRFAKPQPGSGAP
jgi:mono/diheme cytochrome c family protein